MADEQLSANASAVIRSFIFRRRRRRAIQNPLQVANWLEFLQVCEWAGDVYALQLIRKQVPRHDISESHVYLLHSRRSTRATQHGLCQALPSLIVRKTPRRVMKKVLQGWFFRVVGGPAEA